MTTFQEPKQSADFIENASNFHDFNDALIGFMEWANQMKLDSYNATDHPINCRETLGFTQGRKNIKIVCMMNGTHRSAFGFICKETGKIMKAAGWSSPDPKRYERGNIFQPESWAKWVKCTGVDSFAR